MKKILIFTLLLFACRETTINPRCEFVTISDALPVQFWLTDCQTYNELATCGVHQKCWCAPWECDDEIHIQINDINELETYYLSIVGSDGMEINSLPFVNNILTPNLLYFENEDFEGSLSPWTNEIGTHDNTDWQYSGGVALADGSGETNDGLTDILAQERQDIPGSLWPAGTYQIRITFNNQSTGSGTNVLLLFQQYNGSSWSTIFNNSGSTLPLGNNTITFEATLTEDCEKIGLAFTKIPDISGIIYIEVSEFTMLASPGIPTGATLSFVPSDYDICDQQIQLKIFEGDSPETEIAKSDCLDIRTNHSCTNLIQYSNTRNFAGIVYADQSPDEEFYIRVPSIFFHEQSDQETETIELVNSIISLNSDLKWKRLFEVDYVPYYFHKKLQLIFMHQFITVNNKSWVQKDPYEIVEGDRRWPFKKAKVFLNEKNFVYRNVL